MPFPPCRFLGFCWFGLVCCCCFIKGNSMENPHGSKSPPPPCLVYTVPPSLIISLPSRLPFLPGPAASQISPVGGPAHGENRAAAPHEAQMSINSAGIGRHQMMSSLRVSPFPSSLWLPPQHGESRNHSLAQSLCCCSKLRLAVFIAG